MPPARPQSALADPTRRIAGGTHRFCHTLRIFGGPAQRLEQFIAGLSTRNSELSLHPHSIGLQIFFQL